ncbi:MAG: tRNA adenosine(34) deaminase TadA [Nitrospiria bacterium]
MVLKESDERLMQQALAEAKVALGVGEVPVGALLVVDNTTFSSYNLKTLQNDPTAHAEMQVLRKGAYSLGRWRLGGTLYSTLEPCMMCAGALVQARVDRLVYGAADPRGGGCGSIFDIVREPRLNHCIEVKGGVLAEESSRLLEFFFKGLRAEK